MMKRTAFVSIAFAAACARVAPAPTTTPEPVPGPDRVGVRIVNHTDGAPLVWLDPGGLHYRVGVVAPDTTDVLYFPVEWLGDAGGVVRAYPLPFVCYFATPVTRAHAGRVIELVVPHTDSWPEPAGGEEPETGPCDRSDVAYGVERLRMMDEESAVDGEKH